MFVCCECFVLLGRGLCDELITRPEESYRLWCIIVCDLENFKNDEATTRIGSQRHREKKIETHGTICPLCVIPYIQMDVYPSDTTRSCVTRHTSVFALCNGVTVMHKLHCNTYPFV